MLYRIKVIDIELSQPIETIAELTDYQVVQGLVRLHGVPLGYIHLPVVNRCCSANAIVKAIVAYYAYAICRQLAFDQLTAGKTQNWHIKDLLHQIPPVYSKLLPSVSIAFCPRDSRAVDTCLDAIQKLDYANLEVLVVETAPQDDALQKLVETQYPGFRYICQPQAGLNRSRNLAIEKAQGDIIAFCDEQGIPELGWAKALAVAFADHPEVVAVTGLVVPLSIETEAQYLFDQSYGLGRGFDRTWHRVGDPQQVSWTTLGTMKLGTGANVAFRRSLFEKIGTFNPALDLEGVTWSGGELEMFCRILLSGHILAYEPNAIVRYRAPIEYSLLRSQVVYNTIGLYAYIAAGIAAYPTLRWRFITLGLWKLARLLVSLLRPHQTPRSLIWSELQAVWQSWGRYQKAVQAGGDVMDRTPHLQPLTLKRKWMAVRAIDLAQPLPTLNNLSNYNALRVFVNLADVPLGSADVQHCGCPSISEARLRYTIADSLALELLALPHSRNVAAAWTEIQTTLVQHFTDTDNRSVTPPSLPVETPVTVVITTCDRPTDLENCLRHLVVQDTVRPIEIIVADNRPASGLTAPVVARFPNVRLVQETRPGSSYGRNAAIVASMGDIIVTVDDDVTVPPGWLEKLLAPLGRDEVMVVTGNVLPLELDTAAQWLFERVKGGLSQGFKPFEADGNWLSSFQHWLPPVWNLGVSANAAFRASIFCHPQIGLMDEALGAGTPSGGSEEVYLMYKVLKAGYTLVYEPSAYVWHRHRRDLPALCRQLYGYGKSSTAYHLTLMIKERDARALLPLIYVLPNHYIQRLFSMLWSNKDVPWALVWQETAGYLAGYWSYWRSCQKVKRQGRSVPYIPVRERLSQDKPETTEAQTFQVLVETYDD